MFPFWKHPTNLFYQISNYLTCERSILNYLLPSPNAYIKISREAYQKWRNSIPSNYNFSSVFVYLGVDKSKNELVFYFIDSYTAQLGISSDTHHSLPAIKRYFEKSEVGFSTDSIEEDISPKIKNDPAVITSKEVEARRTAWNKQEWYDSLKDNLVRLIVIPIQDFSKVLDFNSNKKEIYLYFGITKDLRPNQYNDKIELIVANYITPEMSKGTVAYDITTPYPPF